MKEKYIEITDLKIRQKLLLELLRQFHNICEEQGLIYNIFGGTMLGAVRHSGFIPWDDDIDVTMPRPDYEKFIKLINEKYSNEFDLYAYPKENYIYPYAKLGMKGTILYENAVKKKFNRLSLNIDIFPNDGYPEDESIFDVYNEYEKNIILCTYELKVPKNPLKFLLFEWNKIKARTKGAEYYIKEQIQLITKRTVEESEYIICQGAGWGKKGKLLKNIYFDRQLYDFDGQKVWGIKDYHEHLTRLYGDYRTPPPKEKQCAPHESTLYILETIYKQIREE